MMAGRYATRQHCVFRTNLKNWKSWPNLFKIVRNLYNSTKMFWIHFRKCVFSEKKDLNLHCQTNTFSWETHFLNWIWIILVQLSKFRTISNKFRYFLKLFDFFQESQCWRALMPHASGDALCWRALMQPASGESLLYRHPRRPKIF